MSRTESFPPDGKRVRAEPKYIIAFWRRYTARVPAKYALATADHESSLTLNEVDVEPNGFVSRGIYQLSDEECQHIQRLMEASAQACMPRLDPMKLDDASRIMACLAEEHLEAIMTCAGLVESSLPGDVWYYCAMAHNMGVSAALRSIREHGLDAAAWTKRNPQLAQAARYFTDCMTGGDYWSLKFEEDEPTRPA